MKNDRWSIPSVLMVLVEFQQRAEVVGRHYLRLKRMEHCSFGVQSSLVKLFVKVKSLNAVTVIGRWHLHRLDPRSKLGKQLDQCGGVPTEDTCRDIDGVPSVGIVRGTS